MDTRNGKIYHILKFLFYKATWLTEIVNISQLGVILDASIHSDKSHVKDAPPLEGQSFENIDKIMEWIIIESDRYNEVNKAGYKKRLGVLMSHDLTRATKWILKRMVMGNEKLVTYDNVK